MDVFVESTLRQLILRPRGMGGICQIQESPREATYARPMRLDATQVKAQERDRLANMAYDL